MQIEKYAWVFLIIGLLGVVLTGSISFVTQSVSSQYVLGAGASTVGFLALYAWLDRQAIQAGATSRVFLHGLSAVVMVIIVGGITIVGYLLAKEHDKSWDLTREKRFSISDKTISIASGLDRDVQILAFFPTNSPERDRFRILTSAMEEASDRVRVKFVDPLHDRRLAVEYTITSEYGTVVLQSGDDRQRLESDFSEDAVAAALIRLTSGVEHRICWSGGHGEMDPDDDMTAQGYGFVVLKLEDQNYTVTKTQVLAQGIDRECGALVIAGPERDWLAVELEALAVYLAEGGRAFVLLEPMKAPLLAADLARYGVEVGDDVVFEPSPGNRLASADDVTLVMGEDNYAHHLITRPLRAITVFVMARSVGGAKGASGLIIHELIAGSARSFGETALLANHPDTGVPTPGADRIGNVPIAVAVEITDPSVIGVAAPLGEPEGDPAGEPEGILDGGRDLFGAAAAVPADFAPKEGGRLVVIGDADFASNQGISIANNQDLFTNSLAWLVEEEDQISAGPEREGDSLLLTLPQWGLVWLFSVFLVPGGSVVLAILVRIRRRFQ